MKEKLKKNTIITVALYAVFVIYTIVIANANVLPIGPQKSEVGLAYINGGFRNLFSFPENGYYIIPYTISKYSLVLIGGIILLFGIFGLMELIQKKKVGRKYFALGITYVVTVFFYVLFEKVIINYRPVIMDEGLEASYPSSHTLLTVVVFGTAIHVFGKLIKNMRLKKLVIVACEVALIGFVVLRLLSGVHWLTDIVGGLILGGCIVMGYFTIYNWLKTKEWNWLG